MNNDKIKHFKGSPTIGELAGTPENIREWGKIIGEAVQYHETLLVFSVQNHKLMDGAGDHIKEAFLLGMEIEKTIENFIKEREQ